MQATTEGCSAGDGVDDGMSPVSGAHEAIDVEANGVVSMVFAAGYARATKYSADQRHPASFADLPRPVDSDARIGAVPLPH